MAAVLSIDELVDNACVVSFVRKKKTCKKPFCRNLCVIQYTVQYRAQREWKH